MEKGWGKIIVANPRLVATTITFGVNRVERKMPEKRPERKLTQRVVVNEAAWGCGLFFTWLAKKRPTIAIAFVKKHLPAWERGCEARREQK